MDFLFLGPIGKTCPPFYVAFFYMLKDCFHTSQWLSTVLSLGPTLFNQFFHNFLIKSSYTLNYIIFSKILI
ncbi:hypothetical protein VIGAN_01393300 [Vigna angularis var. angularis]|uniref:Uncharacterized protein n=1 Tax=Vigna angularis var. angularis TaxID=157739 RepID=A0A0S3R643_PHAAN|nr:hypothetical protein VIGAN_01393300 [Vigna angularis var. angularis]